MNIFPRPLAIIVNLLFLNSALVDVACAGGGPSSAAPEPSGGGAGAKGSPSDQPGRAGSDPSTAAEVGESCRLAGDCRSGICQDVCCEAGCDGPCAECGGDGSCVAPETDARCSGPCPKDTPCLGYERRSASCKGIGSCADDASCEATLTELATPCGDLQVCDGEGSCSLGLKDASCADDAECLERHCDLPTETCQPEAIDTRPEVINVSPKGGAVGASISVVGRNLAESSVQICGKPASIKQQSYDKIEAVIPAVAIGKCDLQVTGAEASLEIRVVPRPTLNSASPAANAAHTGVLLGGTHLNDVVKVTVGGIKAGSRPWSDQFLGISLPDGLAPGSWPIVVGSELAESAPFAYEVLAQAPPGPPQPEFPVRRTRPTLNGYTPPVVDQWTVDSADKGFVFGFQSEDKINFFGDAGKDGQEQLSFNGRPEEEAYSVFMSISAPDGANWEYRGGYSSPEEAGDKCTHTMVLEEQVTRRQLVLHVTTFEGGCLPPKTSPVR